MFNRVKDTDGLQRVAVHRHIDQTNILTEDVVVTEAPVALEFNGLAYVVMMATPLDLTDFALGFALTEGILQHPGELYDCAIDTNEHGIVVRLEIAHARFSALKEQRRHLTGRTGCGLCGVESLAQVMRPLTPVTHPVSMADQQLLAGIANMQKSQALQQACGASHAAAWMNLEGALTTVCEDVGRHNALDKLIGALLRQKQDLSQGAVLITSRASYEMVQKTAIMGIGLLAAISAPTSLAIKLAQQARLTLLGFVRSNSYVIYTHPERVTTTEH